MRTAPSVIISMSQGSSNPASPSRPVPASEQQETITPVSHVLSLSEVSTSLEALNIEVERKPNVVHHAQTSYSPRVSRTGKIPLPVSGLYPQTSDDDTASEVDLVDPSSHKKGTRGRGNRGSRSGESSDSSHSTRSTTSSGGRRKKRDGFSSKIQIPEFGGKKGHSGDVTDASRQWARCITYYWDYYEDSYLMPLVVSYLTGEASDVFNWILILNHGEPQDLTTLFQMLREHYCGSLTFREQRNTIQNLCQKPNEAAIDFLIRVGTLVSNLAKDWKDELTECELQALQYEV